MIHLGDITKIDGYNIPIVDCICGGSPCQDLSVAGKRAGLSGERSGLFMEQVRIFKEMRENDRKRNNRKSNKSIRPRFLVWENVPGALSSGEPAGEDFRIVLEEIARIADGDAVIPRPSDRWTNAGVIVGNGWSIAWRIHDAQFWGTAQRRRRIALVADFGGESVAEILFERKGVSRDIEQSGETRERASEDSERCFDKSSYTLKIRGGVEVDSGGKRAGKGPLIQKEKSSPLGVSQDQTLIQVLNDQGGSVMNLSEDRSGALRASEHGHQPIVLDSNQAKYGTEGGNTPIVLGIDTYNQTISGDVAVTLNAASCESAGHSGPAIFGISSYESNAMKSDNPKSGINETETARTLDLNGGDPSCNQGGVAVVYGESSFGDYTDKHIGTLKAQGGHNGGGSESLAVKTGLVRRLTPLECERLQGFPDGWTEIGSWVDTKGKLHKSSTDSARYKALGNSIAVGYANHQKGFWMWLMQRISERYDRVATLGSLFDGIGGFPLAWEFYNGKGSALWASEIEEFPIAVTKYHFPEGSEIE